MSCKEIVNHWFKNNWKSSVWRLDKRTIRKTCTWRFADVGHYVWKCVSTFKEEKNLLEMTFLRQNCHFHFQRRKDLLEMTFLRKICQTSQLLALSKIGISFVWFWTDFWKCHVFFAFLFFLGTCINHCVLWFKYLDLELDIYIFI